MLNIKGLDSIAVRRRRLVGIHGREYASGTLWSKLDMLDLKVLVVSHDMENAAYLLGRTVTACADMYRNLRRLEVLNSDDPNATLKSITNG